MPLYPASNLIAYNVKDFGAVGDGSHDDTAAISAAMSAASSGGEVHFPGGTFISGNQTLLANVFLRGAGPSATTLKLKSGANTDLLSAQTGSINLSAASGVGSIGTLYNFGVCDITLDGNKAGQSSGTSYPLRFYGYGYIFENLRVKNGRSGGILSDWNGGSNSPGNDAMDAQWINVKVHDCGGIGVEIGGPHDTQVVNCLSFLNDSHGFHIAPNATGMLFVNCHAWGTPQTGVHAVEWLIEAPSGQYSNCVGEGSDACNVVILGNNTIWTGGNIYGSGVLTVVGAQLGQASGGTPYPGSINQSGGLTTSVTATGTIIDSNFLLCNSGSISFVQEGNSFIRALCSQTAGSYFVGSPDTSSSVWICPNGLTPDGSFALGGGVRIRADAFQAYVVSDVSGNDVLNINTHAGSRGLSTVNGALLQGYSDNYGTIKYSLNADGNGSIISKGSLTVGQSASAASLASSGTVTTSGVGVARVAGALAVTGVILQSGTQAGQICTVVNEAANNITFAASGTSHVADGTSDIIAGNTARRFVWDSGTSLWYRCG